MRRVVGWAGPEAGPVKVGARRGPSRRPGGRPRTSARAFEDVDPADSVGGG